MTYSKEQVINGLYKFIDNEIISKCDEALKNFLVDMLLKKLIPYMMNYAIQSLYYLLEL